MNPFFQNFNNQYRQPSMSEQFRNFVSAFKGNPKEQVEQLLRSGQMTKEQFNEYSQMANQLSSMIRRK